MLIDRNCETGEVFVHSDSREHTKVQVSSSRSFGMVFATVFLLIGIFPLIGSGQVRYWAIAIAAGFLVAAVVAPKLLQPLNLLWFRFGMMLGRVVNPIVMFLIYVITFVPIGLLMRLLGKDLLSLKLDASQRSYWVVRAPPGPEPDSLEEQF